ncbi:signal peptidase II [Lutimaribacter marinistellae]|uniref:Lipoprotein signal peptidase n=1 Tax=Lutimaribacter marinistellae TaxID=1820329 RepID=A0ABV7THB0_9RHOB
MSKRLLLWAAAAAFALDQVSKYVVIYGMDLIDRGQIDLLPPLLVFRYGENRGINFGLFQGETDLTRWFLIGLSLIICTIAIVWLRRIRATPAMLICGGFLVGGALGNVLDRLVYGYVLDFLNMSCCGIRNPYVFNVADIFIFAGAIGLVLLDGKKGG